MLNGILPIMDNKLQQLEIMAHDLIRYYVPEYTFKWDNAVWRHGVCKFSTKTISISKNLAIINTVEVVLDTVLHEIAHALAGSTAGHSSAWKKQALEIGCSGERTAGKDHVSAQRKWRGKCPNLDCNRTIYRHRRKRLSCGRCSGGVFDADYLFIWSEVPDKNSLESADIVNVSQ